jgi:hypothetical protein
VSRYPKSPTGGCPDRGAASGRRDEPQAVYEFDEYSLDVADERLLRGNAPVRLPPMEFRILQLLLERPRSACDEAGNCSIGYGAARSSRTTRWRNAYRASGTRRLHYVEVH